MSRYSFCGQRDKDKFVYEKITELIVTAVVRGTPIEEKLKYPENTFEAVVEDYFKQKCFKYAATRSK